MKREESESITAEFCERRRIIKLQEKSRESCVNKISLSRDELRAVMGGGRRALAGEGGEVRSLPEICSHSPATFAFM